MISSIIQALFKIKLLSNLSGEEKKCQRIYDLLNAETKPMIFLSTIYKAKKSSYKKESF